jgi:hypothetical protein
LHDPTAKWSKTRDALAAFHNFQTLLKSPRVGANVLAALLPELRMSCARVREAFRASATAERSELVELAQFANARLQALEEALYGTSETSIEVRERLALEQLVERVSGELGPAVDLLELVDRADAPLATELSLEELARAALGIGSSLGQGEEIRVRIDTSDAACHFVADARVVSRLVVLAASCVRSAMPRGALHDLTVRARCEPRVVKLVIAASDETSAKLPAFAAKVGSRIGPTDAIVQAAARAIGATIELGDVVILTLPRA